MQIYPHCISFGNSAVCQNFPKKEASAGIKNNNSGQNCLFAKGNYNVAFCGLFGEKPIDARFNDDEIKMIPEKKYLVNDDAQFNLGGHCILNLKSNDISEQIRNLGIGKKIVFGREGYFVKGMDKQVSRRHLEISKNLRGQLIATDLNSLNGTTIKGKAAAKPENTQFERLQPLRKTPIPIDCQLILGTDMVIDMRNPNIRGLVDENGIVKIGRSKYSDIVIDDFHSQTSREHLILTRQAGTLYAIDYDSTNGTFVVPKNKVRPFYRGAKNIELSQSNVGDCFLLSTIYSMSKTDKGAKILEDMIEVDDNGNYIVTFVDGSSYVIKPEELDGQKSTKGNRDKRSVSGELGVKAIERAYARDMKSDCYRKTMFADIDNGGYTTNAMYKMTGLFGSSHKASAQDTPYIFSKIKNEGMNNHIVTCSTPHIGKYGNYMDAERRFITGHAYTICDIDVKNQLVTIANPYNTRKKQVISWNDFANIFSYFSDVKIS